MTKMTTMMKMLEKNQNIYENNFGQTQTAIGDVSVVVAAAVAANVVPPHY